MGFFKKMAESFTGTDADDIPNGVLATGLIVSYQPTGTKITNGTMEYRICEFGLQVYPENGQPYTATSRQKILEWEIARIQPGQSVCAVRIDPENPQRVAIDWTTEPPGNLSAAPTNTSARTAEEVIASGEACEVVIASFQAMGQNHPRTGQPLYAFMLNVIPQAGDPYQAQVGLSVEPKFLPKLFNGAQLPAKRVPESPNEVVIDWVALEG